MRLYRAKNAAAIAAAAAKMREGKRAELAAASREYARANADRVRERNRAYYYANKDRRSAENKAWRQANAERLREYYLSPKGRAKSAARNAARVKATVHWADKAAIAAIYRECVEISLRTGTPHHVDHIVPLRNKRVCGLHLPVNLQILTQEENYMKRNKFEVEA